MSSTLDDKMTLETKTIRILNYRIESLKKMFKGLQIHLIFSKMLLYISYRLYSLINVESGHDISHWCEQ